MASLSQDLVAPMFDPILPMALRRQAAKVKTELDQCFVEYITGKTILTNGQYLCMVKQTGRKMPCYVVKTFLGQNFIETQDKVLSYFPESLS